MLREIITADSRVLRHIISQLGRYRAGYKILRYLSIMTDMFNRGDTSAEISLDVLGKWFLRMLA